MNFTRQLYIYSKMSVKTVLRFPGIHAISYCIRYFPAWRQSMRPDRSPVNDAYPWLCFPAIDFLEKRIRPDMHIFEYGSGGSTLFWAARTKDVVSVEHDPSWFRKMENEIHKRKIGNITYLLAEPAPDKEFDKKDIRRPEDYISSDAAYSGLQFERYVKTIDQYPDGRFDIVIVDGRARPSCMQHAVKKIKDGGYLVIDNSERDHYLSSFKPGEPFREIRHFPGPTPYGYNFSVTSVLKK